MHRRWPYIYSTSNETIHKASQVKGKFLLTPVDYIRHFLGIRNPDGQGTRPQRFDENQQKLHTPVHSGPLASIWHSREKRPKPTHTWKRMKSDKVISGFPSVEGPGLSRLQTSRRYTVVSSRHQVTVEGVCLGISNCLVAG